MKLTSWRRKKSAPTIVMFFALAVIGLGVTLVSSIATSSNVQAQIGSNETLVDKGSQLFLEGFVLLVMVQTGGSDGPTDGVAFSDILSQKLRS